MSALQLAMLDEPARAPIVLRDYQQECLDAIHAAAARGVRRQLVVLPTGAGKTIVFATLVDSLLTWEGGRALVLAHRDELVQQAVDKFRMVAGARYTLGVIKAERNEVDRQVLVGSVQTLAGSRRLAQLPASELTAVVIDECHHAMAATYRRIVAALHAGQPGGPLLLGFTATPDRGDGQRIGTVFDELVYSKSILDLIDAGYLCDVEARSIQIAADFGAIHSRAGDLDQGELDRALVHANAPRRVLEAYQGMADGRKALVFTPGVKLARELASLFSNAGISAEAVDGTMPQLVRRAILRRYEQGATRVLCNDSVLTEGYDDPSTDCIILARPTKSRPLYAQMIGRGLRPSPGKTNCLVLDLCGNAGRHDLATIPEVFGLPAAHDVPSIKQQAKEERERQAISERVRVRDLERAKLVARTVDLFRGRAGVLGQYHWVVVEINERPIACLDLGDGLLKMGEAEPNNWAVVLNRKDRAPSVLWRNLPQQAAQDAAERYWRAHAKPWLHGVAWRTRRATQKQINAIRHCGCSMPATATAGEVADAFLRVHAARGYHA